MAARVGVAVAAVLSIASSSDTGVSIADESAEVIGSLRALVADGSSLTRSKSG